MMNEMKLLLDRIYESAVPMAGIAMSWAQAHARLDARVKDDFVTDIIVRDWLWVDVTSIPDVQHQLIQADGLQPTVLITRNVWYRSDRLFVFEKWERSSLLRDFTEGCFFQSGDSRYLMVGDGLRTSVDSQTLEKMVSTENFND